jgi:hypothetical protein
MLKRKRILAALATSSIAVLALPAAAAAVYVDVAPPAPRYEVVPTPRHGHVWIPGFWDYRGHHHVWVKGHWERERHGMYWHPSRWEQREGRYYLERGRWDRERFVDNRDRDRDGVPNRVDRDRDGDGVPNRLDRAPDNPHRQ